MEGQSIGAENCSRYIVTKNSSIVYMLCENGFLKIELDYKSLKMKSFFRKTILGNSDRCIGIAYSSKYDRVFTACIINAFTESALSILVTGYDVKTGSPVQNCLGKQSSTFTIQRSSKINMITVDQGSMSYLVIQQKDDQNQNEPFLLYTFVIGDVSMEGCGPMRLIS